MLSGVFLRPNFGDIWYLKKETIMVELKEKLLLNYLDTSNTAMCSGEFDMPALRCNIDVYPDFLALDSEPGKYFKTNLTGVCFFRYDDRINGWDGLFNAIYYN